MWENTSKENTVSFINNIEIVGFEEEVRKQMRNVRVFDPEIFISGFSASALQCMK